MKPSPRFAPLGMNAKEMVGLPILGSIARSAANKGFWASLLDCFYCLSLWIAVPFAALLGDGWEERLLFWPALSGGAIVLERLTAKDGSDPIVYFTGREEESDNVLRQEQNDTKDRDFRPDT